MLWSCVDYEVPHLQMSLPVMNINLLIQLVILGSQKVAAAPAKI